MRKAKKTTTRTNKTAGQRLATKVALRWLTATMGNGRRRIETLGWKALAAMYEGSRPGSPIRRAINAEARRCGYAPSTILALNAE